MRKTIIWLAIFSVAMGFLESAVVIYIREMYYPEGFKFPLKYIPNNIVVVELWRELATIVMLIAIGILAGKSKAQKFVYFLFSFGIWDIFYYVFLKVFLNWPESLFTWDILFLLPVPWVGPVLAPCLVSLTMIGLTALILWIEETGHVVILKPLHYLLLSLGCTTIIASFVSDYLELLFGGYNNLSAENMLVIFKHYEPNSYNWYLFAIGEIIIFSAGYFIYKESTKEA